MTLERISINSELHRVAVELYNKAISGSQEKRKISVPLDSRMPDGRLAGVVIKYFIPKTEHMPEMSFGEARAATLKGKGAYFNFSPGDKFKRMALEDVKPVYTIKGPKIDGLEGIIPGRFSVRNYSKEASDSENFLYDEEHVKIPVKEIKQRKPKRRINPEEKPRVISEKEIREIEKRLAPRGYKF